MKFTFIMPSLVGGGAEFVVKTWAEELTKRGNQVEIALVQYTEHEPIIASPIKHLVPEGSSRLREMGAILRILRQAGRDEAVLAIMTRANLQLCLLTRLLPARRRPTILISERNIPLRDTHHSVLHVVVRNVFFSTYRWADGLIAISHPVGAVFLGLGKLDARKILVVPNPAIGKLEPLKGPVAIRPRNKHLTLVIPARLATAKRPLLALAVARKLQDVGWAVSVQYFGVGPLDQQIRDAGNGLDVQLMGRVEKWFNNLPADSVVLLTSAVEGFANVLLEAAASGIPSVVGSIALGSADAVIPGVTGEFARTDDVDGYLDAVTRAATIDSIVPEGWLYRFSSIHSTNALIGAVNFASVNRDAPGTESSV